MILLDTWQCRFGGGHSSAKQKNPRISAPLSPEWSCLMLFLSYVKSQVIPCPTCVGRDAATPCAAAPF